MPEDNLVQPSQTQNATTQELPAELKQQMDASINGFVRPSNQIIEQPPPVTQPAQTTVIPEIIPPVVSDAPVLVQDAFAILKDKFQYQNPEDAVAEIESLRAFKNAPVTSSEIKFENEDSEKLFKAIASGKRKEAYQILDKLERIESLTGEVTKDNADQIIKLAMQLENPDLTGDEVNYRFNKMFTVPKAPVWDKATEEEEDYNNRKADWQSQVEDVEMNKRIEAKLAKPKLEAAKSKIVFPEIENQVDERVTQYLKMLEDEPKLNEEIKESYKKITPQALETKIKFTDEPNKIDFEFQYVPDGDSFNKAVEIASDWNKIVDHFKKSDGSPDREGFAKAMHFMLNAKSIITEAMNQSKNATLKSMLPNNSGSGLQRQFPQTQELSDLDKQMQLSLNGYGRR
jgi:hypothetical protein